MHLGDIHRLYCPDDIGGDVVDGVGTSWDARQAMTAQIDPDRPVTGRKQFRHAVPELQGGAKGMKQQHRRRFNLAPDLHVHRYSIDPDEHSLPTMCTLIVHLYELRTR